MKRRPAPLEAAPLARTNFMSDYTYTRHLHARIHSTPGHVSTVRLSFSLSASLSRATKDRTSAPSHTAHPLKAQPNPHTQHIYPPTASLAPFATQHTNHEREDDSRSKHSRAQEARNATTKKRDKTHNLYGEGPAGAMSSPTPVAIAASCVGAPISFAFSGPQYLDMYCASLTARFAASVAIYERVAKMTFAGARRGHAEARLG